MQYEPDDVDEALRELRTLLDATLGASLFGLYLYGSAASNNFTQGVSDLDLLVVTSHEVDGDMFDRLEEMHSDFATRNPEWHDRVDVQYVSAAALRQFKSRASRIVVISPGEPFGYKQAGDEWALNWFDVQENGIALVGPSPSRYIPPLTGREFVESVVQYVRWKADRIGPRRGAEAYAILTTCRALWTIETGTTTSKEAGAAWAAERLPDWAALIRAAVECRRNPDLSREPGDDASRRGTLGFVRFASGRLPGSR